MNTEIQIEFNKIKDMWSGLATTDHAKELIERLKLFWMKRSLGSSYGIQLIAEK